MTTALLIVGYLLGVVVLSWLESKLLMALDLGGRWGGMAYTVIANLICSVVAPVGVVASVVAGFLGVFSAINNTQGITTQKAFNSFAGPLAFIALGVVVVARMLPLLLMNIKTPFKALIYAVLSTAALSLLFTFGGIALMATLPSSPPSTPSPSASP